MKKACGTWLAVYLLLAAALAAIAYRRLPVPQVALGAGVIGGGIALLGVAYIAGIGQKLKSAALIRRGLNGEPPRDGEKFAAIGRITPKGATLTSPFTKTSCVAYKYEIKVRGSKHDTTVFDGFALTPSTIQTGNQSIRLLAWGEIKQSFKSIPVSEAKPNAEDYLAKTEFAEPSILNLRQAITDLQAIYRDDDGSVRRDQRGVRPNLDTGSIDLDVARYNEVVLRPGDPVCVIGRYSAQRGGIVPSDHPIADPVTIEVGEPDAFVPRARFGAVGYLIGGAIFLGVALVALLAFHAAIPLDAAEQMSPTMLASWPEIRFERFLDKRVRPLMRQAGMLGDGEAVIQLPPGSANGRVRGEGRDVVVSRATAQRINGGTTVTIDDGVIVLTTDANRRPVQLTVLGQNVPPAAADIRINEESEEIKGRMTYLPEHDTSLACRVTFCARR